MKIHCPKCNSIIDTEADPEHIGHEPDFAFCRNPDCLWVTNLKTDVYSLVCQPIGTPRERPFVPAGNNAQIDPLVFGEIKSYSDNAYSFLEGGDFDSARAWFFKWVEYVKQGSRVYKELEDELDRAKKAYSDFAKTDPAYIKCCEVLLPTIRDNPGILQTDIYKILSYIPKEVLSYTLYFVADHGRVLRIKKGRTYTLSLLDEPLIAGDIVWSQMREHFRDMVQIIDIRPYWQYFTVGDDDVRPSHRPLHGIIKPADDSFWKVWFPPNGDKCRCTVVSLSEGEMREEKLRVTQKIPFKPGHELPEEGYRFDPWKVFL